MSNKQISVRAFVLATACLAALPVLAQEVTGEVEEVLVTASRVARSGFTAPTPTAVISAADVQAVAPLQISEALQQIPTFRVSGTSSTANVYANLRGIGAQRTLLLVDGRRHVSSQSDGTVDLNLIPTSMISRTEVVTGGASASWGSDAVTGVVNLILRKDLDGTIANVQGGLSKYHDDQNFSASLAFGHAIGSRGHLLIGGEYSETRGIPGLQPPGLSRPWTGRGLIINGQFGTPNTDGFGLPGRIYAEDTRRADVSPGGLITGGVLRGLQFLPGGNTSQFGFGKVFGNNMIGGTDNFGETATPGGDVKFPFQRHVIMAHYDHDLTDSVQLFAEGTYAHSLTEGHTNPIRNNGSVATANPTCTQVTTAPVGSRFSTVPASALGSITVGIDNPYLPASVRALMTTRGINCFPLGRSFRDPGLGDFQVSDGQPYLYRGVVGAKGKLTEKWSWDTYVQYGHNLFTQARIGNRNEANFRLAVDAVTNSQGQIVCRIALTTPNTPCVPFNLFGEGSPSQASIGYITGTSELHSETWQTVGAFTVRGEPFRTWADAVSLATGIEYRKERVDAVADPISEANGWNTGNRKAIRGDYDVKEGFVEVVVPLAKEQAWAHALDLNLAARYTNYSTSGGVTSWKGGVSYAINEQFRLRGTKSRDIRAGNLSELFTATSVTVGNLRNSTPLATSGQVQGPVTTTGNSSLAPEEAETITAGFVYEPSWLQGFRTSIDYYRIIIDGQIGTLQAQQVLDRCFIDKLAVFCADVTTNTGLYDINAIPSAATVRFQNLDEVKTSGVDIEAAYRLPLSRVADSVPGNLSVRVLGTYLKELTTRALSGATPTNPAGQFTLPHWTVFGTLGYDVGRFSGVLDLRYFGGGTIDNTAFVGLLATNGVNINEVGSTLYTNTTLQWDFGSAGMFESAQVYLRVNNVFDKPLPFPATTGGLFDEVGRAYRVGLRVKF